MVPSSGRLNLSLRHRRLSPRPVQGSPRDAAGPCPGPTRSPSAFPGETGLLPVRDGLAHDCHGFHLCVWCWRTPGFAWRGVHRPPPVSRPPVG